MNVFKINRKTHIDTVRESYSNQMEEVCQILAWKQNDFCMHQFAEYERFAKIVSLEFPHLLNRIRYSPVFRGFWVNEWAQRNQLNFIPYSKECAFSRIWILDEYLFLNDAERLYRDEGFYIRFENILKSI
jgi:hypothetical protein